MELGLAFLVIFGIFGSSCAQDFYVAAPSIFRVNSDETIAIAMDGDSGALVYVCIQDYPDKVKNISQVVVEIRPGLPEIIKIHLDVNDFPENFFKSPEFPKLVSLNAQFPNTHREIVIPVSSESGYIFIQTDKPIYTPKERVSLRILSLTEEVVLSEEPFKLQIRNPDNVIVEETFYNERKRNFGRKFVNHLYMFPTHPVLGEWSASVRFGHNLEQNSTIRFMLREYVMPTFTVELKTPGAIHPSDEEITVEVNVRHLYGKNVKGTVSFRLGVKSEHADKPRYFGVFSRKELNKGQYTLNIKTYYLKRHKDIGWFPEIHKSHLVVEAVVVDYATGNKEEVIDSKAIFSKSPFIISFKRCPSDFKPGLTSVIEADINYVNGIPAQGILAKLTAVAVIGQTLPLDRNTTISDENGRVAFEIRPELHHKTVRLLLETKDPRYGENQARETFKQFAHVSPSYAYIAISRSRELRRLKPGNTHTIDVYIEPAELENIYYLVVARGKILDIGKIAPGMFKLYRVELKITHEMVPYFRVVIFTHHKGELVADSLKIEVESDCHPEAEVNIDTEFYDKEPGGNGKIIIRGTTHTFVGLLAVDEALLNKGLLTKTKMFENLASHDLGCGPGGGLNITDVLRNSGITLVTNKYSPSRSQFCVEINKSKREMEQNITEQAGVNRGERVETDLSSDRVEFIDDDTEEGSEREMTDEAGYILRERVPNDELEFIDEDMEDEFEREIVMRSDFRKTWIYQDIILGPDGREELPVSLPHAITAWVIHGMSVSPEHGICVSEPKTLVSFKRLFLHLNLPYSAVRNEQIEIQAIVFNYQDIRVEAIVYMYGAKDLCSGAQPGTKSDRKRVVVEAQSSVSVAFPVIPLATGHISIKVVLLSASGADIFVKDLYVVPEGVPKKLEIPIKLDPTNQQRREKSDITTPFYIEHIDTLTNLQVTMVNLFIPEEFVPGSESCTISALGDMFGPFVKTSIMNPDELLQKPQGNGEENMRILAITVYAMKYLKVNGKLTSDIEVNGYEFIRHGYNNQLSFRKDDGSYADDQNKPTSTWLTAFVIKVLCQAKMLVHVDDNIICSGVQWLIRNQEPDGSYVEKPPIYDVDIMGGVNGDTLMTAFTLIALEECKCSTEVLVLSKLQAVAYLENQLGDVTKPLHVAIVAYALALSDSDFKQVAYDKLQSMAQYNEDNDWMYWFTDNAEQDIETAGYGLLTQLLFNDIRKSSSIVKWLNEKNRQSGLFKSTQDTVIVLQAFSEYFVRTHPLSINLISNITSSNDRHFYEVLRFNDENAHILKHVKVLKIGGKLFIQTTGQGMGSLIVTLRYNVIQPVKDVCKFDLTVNVTDAGNADDSKDGTIKLDLKLPDISRERTDLLFDSSDDKILRRGRRQSQEGNNNIKLNITLCLRYLGYEEAGLSIVDVGIFSGFEALSEDLKQLERDPTHLINRFEKSSRGVVFNLDKVPVERNYCFSFRVKRLYIVENVQTSVIRVYKYNNPDEICTTFFSPGGNNPLLRTICDGNVCQCAEGACPPKTPFSEIDSLQYRNMLDEMTEIICTNYDYVWKGRLDERIRNIGGFLNISFFIEEVIKEGIESQHDLTGESRTLLALSNCQTAVLRDGVKYLVLGKDGKPYKNENNEIRFRYILDQTSVVFQWSSVTQSPNRQLQRALNRVTKEVKEGGCHD